MITFDGPAVTAAWLAEHLGDVVIADVRWSVSGGAKQSDYRAGHIPGAVFVDLDRDLADPPGPGTGRHPLPEPDRFAAGARGVGHRRGHAGGGL